MTPSAIPFATGLILIAAFASSGLTADEYAVFKSNDRGRSWTRSDTGLPEGSRINAFGSANESLLAGLDSGIFISKDGALSWQSTTCVASCAGRILSFASLDETVFAGTDGNGILQSSDGGTSWAVDGRFPARKVRCLLAQDGWLYAGTDAEGVFASSDAGHTWTRISAGLPSPQQVFALSAAGRRVFAGLYSRGLYAWDEEKQSWEKTGSVAPLALGSVRDTLIAGHNPGGLFWSADLGTTWSKGAAGDHAAGPLVPLLSRESGALPSEAPVWELGAIDDVVFAGAAAGIYLSDDHGRTWTRARGGLPHRSPAVAFLLKRDIVLAGTLIEGSAAEPERGNADPASTPE